MISYRLVQTRRHTFELRVGAEVVAEIGFQAGARAVVSTPGRHFVLEAIDGIHRRVVRHDERDTTVARVSSLARYAADLKSRTLYWHSLHGPAGTYAWKTSDGMIAVRYASSGDGDFVVQAVADVLPAEDREEIVVIGAYLLARTWIEIGPFGDANRRSQPPDPRSKPYAYPA